MAFGRKKQEKKTWAVKGCGVCARRIQSFVMASRESIFIPVSSFSPQFKVREKRKKKKKKENNKKKRENKNVSKRIKHKVD